MILQCCSSRWFNLPLALFLALSMFLSLMVGLTQAQSPEPHKMPDLKLQTVPPETLWLILDPAQPIEAVLPTLLEQLDFLQSRGIVLSYEPSPQQSAPTAVSGLRLLIPAEHRAALQTFPLAGVLDVSLILPPPPPQTGLGAQAITGQISGRITEEGSNISLSGASVSVYDAASYAPIGSTSTDASGYYTLTVTAPYNQVRVLVTHDPTHTSEWYNDKSFFSEANRVDLSQGGHVSDINIALSKYGTLRGTVNHDGGGPADGLTINIYPHNPLLIIFPFPVASPTTDASGKFTATVPAGPYKVEFVDSNYNFAHEYYQDQLTLEAAEVVTVTPGKITPITAVVNQVGTVSGYITEASSGNLLESVKVFAYTPEGSLIGGSTSNASGQYEIKTLGAGTYKLRIWHEKLKYEVEYYNNKANLETADLITVHPLSTTWVNAALTPATGIITGTLTRDGGNPLAPGTEVEINLYDAPTADPRLTASILNFVGDGVTTTYSFTVAAGSYKLLFTFYNPSYRYEWYNDRRQFKEADTVTVKSGQTTPNLNVDLPISPPGQGTITGTVQNNGLPISGARVWLFRYGAEGDERVATTDAQGHYQFDAVEAGNDYQLAFTLFPSTTTWYNDALSRAEADLVSVITGSTTSNINGSLHQLGGCLSGKVIDGYAITVWDMQGNKLPVYNRGWYSMEATILAFTHSDSSFTVCGLPTGNYIIQCFGLNDRVGYVPTHVTAPQETANLVCDPDYRGVHIPILRKD